MKKLNLLAVGSLAMLMSLTTVNAECTAQRGEDSVASITQSSEPKYCTDVKEAVDNADAGTTVTLLDDYTFTGTQDTDRIKISKNLTFDFGEYTITIGELPVSFGGVVVTGAGTNVTFVGTGGITRTNGSAALLVNGGANVTINGGTFTKSGEPDDKQNHSAIDVVSAELTIAEDEDKITITGGVGVFGTSPKLTIESGTITGEGFAVSGNGSTTSSSTINITGGTLTSTGSAAIYHPQTGTLTISGNAEVTGLIGIVARQGTVTITGGKITATGTGEEGLRVGDACENGKTCSASSDNYVKLPQGSAVIVDNHLTGTYTNKATVAIENGEFVVPEGNSTALDYENATEDKNIAVKGGTFIAGEEADKTILTFVDNSENENLGQSDSGVIGTLHKVTFEEPENGTIEVPANAAEGETFTITVEPAEGFKVSKVLVNGTEITPNEDGTYTYTMGEANVTVTAEFTKIEDSGDVPATTPDDETTDKDKTEEETPNTLDKAPIYLTVGAVALTSVTALGYMVKKKLED